MRENIPNTKLRDARNARNWKQQDLADKIGTTSLSVGRWERGETFPSAYYRQKLCDLFELSSEDLGFAEVKQQEEPGTQKEQVLPLPQSIKPLELSSEEPDGVTGDKQQEQNLLPPQQLPSPTKPQRRISWQLLLTLFLTLCIISLGIWVFSSQHFLSSSASPTHAVSLPCPYATRTAYDSYESSQFSVPQKCYLIVSLFNGTIITPDDVGIPHGALVVYQGPMVMEVSIRGGGGFAGYSNMKDAKKFYCYELTRPNAHEITKTHSSLDWASTCPHS